MHSQKKTISPLLYYILISSLTNFVFLGIGSVVFILLSSQIFDNTVVIIIAILLLWKGGVVAFVSWLFRKYQNMEFVVMFIGRYLGRFYGMFIGVFVGAGIANILKLETIIGSIVGALLLYFIGRWAGAKVSLTIGNQVDKIFTLTENQEEQRVVNTSPSKKLFFVVYVVVLPLLFVVIAWTMKYFEIPIDYLVEMSLIARIIVIGSSIFSICYPWIMRKRWLAKNQSTYSSPELMVILSGIIFFIVPVVYGFVLFVAFGLSIIELCIFAFASSVAALIWLVKNPMPIKQKTESISSVGKDLF